MDGVRGLYVLITEHGQERFALANIKRAVQNTPGLGELVFEVLAPETSTVIETTQVVQRRRLAPNQLWIDMILNDFSEYCISAVKGVKQFQRTRGQILPVPEEEARQIKELLSTGQRTPLQPGDQITVREGILRGKPYMITAVSPDGKSITFEVPQADGTTEKVTLNVGAVKMYDLRPRRHPNILELPPEG